MGFPNSRTWHPFSMILQVFLGHKILAVGTLNSVQIILRRINKWISYPSRHAILCEANISRSSAKTMERIKTSLLASQDNQTHYNTMLCPSLEQLTFYKMQATKQNKLQKRCQCELEFNSILRSQEFFVVTFEVVSVHWTLHQRSPLPHQRHNKSQHEHLKEQNFNLFRESSRIPSDASMIEEIWLQLLAVLLLRNGGVTHV